ncbi:MAG TPA: sodium:proton antiporter, partial [Flavobacteriales bacterium]|nr:sodium:proton antiporter [Flavobacteriales bacterium]
MYALIGIVFIVGYLCIALEHPLRINKAATALLTGVLIWVIMMLGQQDLFGAHEGHAGSEGLVEELMHHLGDIASILFFLM